MSESLVKLKPKERPFYVSNVELYKVYVDWYKDIIKARKKKKDDPEIPEYIASAIIKICTRLSYRPNFINYSYKEEMVGDAIENCIKTIKSFNPEKSTNPFSYLTTIAWNAFLRRIEAEKKQTYVKAKLIEDLPIDELVDIQDHDDETMHSHSQFLDYLKEHSYIVGTELLADRKKKKKPQLNEDTSFFDLLTKEGD